MQIATIVFKYELITNPHSKKISFDESHTYNPPKTRKKKPMIKKTPENEIINEDNFLTRYTFRLPSNNFREINYQ